MPRIIAIDVPAETMLMASAWYLGGATRTAIGVVIDQNTAWAHATTSRATTSIANPVARYESACPAANTVMTARSNPRYPKREDAIMSGSDRSMTAQA